MDDWGDPWADHGNKGDEVEVLKGPAIGENDNSKRGSLILEGLGFGEEDVWGTAGHEVWSTKDTVEKEAEKTSRTNDTGLNVDKVDEEHKEAARETVASVKEQNTVQEVCSAEASAEAAVMNEWIGDTADVSPVENAAAIISDEPVALSIFPRQGEEDASTRSSSASDTSPVEAPADSPRTSIEEDRKPPKEPKDEKESKEVVSHEQTDELPVQEGGTAETTVKDKEPVHQDRSGEDTKSEDPGQVTPVPPTSQEDEDDDFGDFESETEELADELPGVEEPAVKPTQVDQHSSAEREQKAVSAEFAIDMSLVNDLFPSPKPVEPPRQDKDDPIYSTSARKAWYRITRKETLREFDRADGNNYIRVTWPRSTIRNEVNKIVTRWATEDRLNGKATLGGKATAVFNWDQPRRSNESSRTYHSNHSSVISTKASTPVESSPTASFGWNNTGIINHVSLEGAESEKPWSRPDSPASYRPPSSFMPPSMVQAMRKDARPVSMDFSRVKNPAQTHKRAVHSTSLPGRSASAPLSNVPRTCTEGAAPAPKSPLIPPPPKSPAILEPTPESPAVQTSSRSSVAPPPSRSPSLHPTRSPNLPPLLHAPRVSSPLVSPAIPPPPSSAEPPKLTTPQPQSNPWTSLSRLVTGPPPTPAPVTSSANVPAADDDDDEWGEMVQSPAPAASPAPVFEAFPFPKSPLQQPPVSVPVTATISPVLPSPKSPAEPSTSATPPSSLSSAPPPPPPQPAAGPPLDPLADADFSIFESPPTPPKQPSPAPPKPHHPHHPQLVPLPPHLRHRPNPSLPTLHAVPRYPRIPGRRSSLRAVTGPPAMQDILGPRSPLPNVADLGTFRDGWARDGLRHRSEGDYGSRPRETDDQVVQRIVGGLMDLSWVLR